MGDSTLDMQKVETVLLIELNRFGDVVHALPAACAFKRAMPRAKIAMLVEQANRELVSLVPCVDRIVAAEGSRTVAGLLRTIRTIRRERFDLVVSLSPVRRNAALALAARGGRKAGYLCVWQRTPPYLRRSAVTARGFSLAGAEEYGFDHMGLAASKVCTALGIPADREKVTTRRVQSDRDLIPGNSYIVFHPFAGWRFREWPAKLAREFLTLSLQSTALSIVMIGDISDEGRARALAELPGHEGRVHVHTGLPVAQLTELISHAAAFVGTDSGPYQLCAFLGKPAVGLFGPNAPEISGSDVEGSRIVYRRLECSPCDQRRCVRPEASCMMLITPAEVLANMRELLR